jgi:energy-converting hydrogenase Eha subunit E
MSSGEDLRGNWEHNPCVQMFRVSSVDFHVSYVWLADNSLILLISYIYITQHSTINTTRSLFVTLKQNVNQT